MKHIRREYNDAKATHKKARQRKRDLRSFIIEHHVLLLLALAENFLALFVVINYPGPYREALAIILTLSFLLGLYMLFAGIDK